MLMLEWRGHRLTVQYRGELHAGNSAWTFLIKAQKRRAPTLTQRNGSATAIIGSISREDPV
jgi:hypothetical protein